MKIKKILYSSHFAKRFKKLPRTIQKKAITREEVFRKNCFNAGLKTHKLKGELKHYWSFSVDYSYRVLFEFIDKNTVGFIDVGDHSIYN